VRARLATDADVDAICRICADGYRDTNADLLTVAQIEAIVADFYRPERVGSEIGAALPDWGGWVVAEDDDGTPVCAGGGGMNAPDVGELYVIYADPALRRRGGGTAVLDLVSEQQRGAGARAQEVAVNPGNQLGMSFYRRHRFAAVGTRPPFHPAQDGPSLILRRGL
jgi:ribosomal protein S18 acetylase RimI-like enzyme